jgi:hypothetical protein
MKRFLFCLAALAASATGTAAHAQYQVSAPNIRYEEWHWSDQLFGQSLVGHFIEYCNGSYASYGHPDAYNIYANGDCEGQ